MKLEGLLQQIEEMVKSPIEDMDYELYHLEYIKEDNEYYLRIYIDSPKGISLEDCEKVSRRVSDIIDEKDPIKDQYYLEISSPGINRFLYTKKHYEDNLGKKVKIRATTAIEGKKLFEGILESYEEDLIKVKINDNIINVPLDKIKTINIEVDF